MNDTDENSVKDVVNHFLFTDIAFILNTEMYYGYWQTYLFNNVESDYEPIYEPFIFYKGKFFNDLESKPWNKKQIDEVRLLTNYFNRDGNPVCVFRFERPL